MFETETELEPDPVIEAYNKDIDRTLIRENLKLTVEQRWKIWSGYSNSRTKYDARY